MCVSAGVWGVATALPVVEPRIQCHYFPDAPRIIQHYGEVFFIKLHPHGSRNMECMGINWVMLQVWVSLSHFLWNTFCKGLYMEYHRNLTNTSWVDGWMDMVTTQGVHFSTSPRMPKKYNPLLIQCHPHYMWPHTFPLNLVSVFHSLGLRTYLSKSEALC
jgi:hypothetical protein